MLWDNMTKEIKYNWYKSYISEMYYENGDNCHVMTFEEYDKENKGHYFYL